MNEKVYRNENKFIIDIAQAELLKNQISLICQPDSHACGNGFYDIKSLYFDTIDDQYYRENLAGVNVRHKYRIRIYDNDVSVINLERKSTEAGLKHKDSCKLLKNQVDDIIAGNIMTDCSSNQPVLHEFQMEHLQRFLLPKVIVCYRRIPFIHETGNVRVTFDYRIGASSKIDDFFDKELQCTPILERGFIVLEVKYDDVLPKAIRDIINGSGVLNQTAFSKYALSRECLDSYLW